MTPSTKYYNKLVRDRIPAIICAGGKTCDIDILDDEAFKKALDAKLDEELAEYRENPSVEELADLVTVLFYLAKVNGFTWDEVQNRVTTKAQERGGFDCKVFLKATREKVYKNG